MRIASLLLLLLATSLSLAQFKRGWERSGYGPLALTSSQKIRLFGLETIEAIDRNGNLIWSRPHGLTNLRQIVTAGEDTIYSGLAQGSNVGQVVCLDSDGNVRWSKVFTLEIVVLRVDGDYLYLGRQDLVSAGGGTRRGVVLTKLDRQTGVPVWEVPCVAVEQTGWENCNGLVLSGGHLFMVVVSHPDAFSFSPHVLRVDPSNGEITSQASVASLGVDVGIAADGANVYFGSGSTLTKLDGAQAPIMPVLWTKPYGSSSMAIVAGNVYTARQDKFHRTTALGVQSLLHQMEDPEHGYASVFRDVFGSIYTSRYYQNGELAMHSWSVARYLGAPGFMTGIGSSGYGGGVVSDSYGTVFANGGYSHYSIFNEYYSQPEPQPDTYNLRVGSVLSVDAPGLMANDRYVDPAKCIVALVTPPAHGSASVSADGSFTYSPDLGFLGQDTFTCRVTRGTLSATASAAVVVYTDVTLSLNKTQVAGQNSVQGTVTLASPPTTPTPVSISDDSALVAVPASVLVPAGQLSKIFQIQTAPVTSPVAVTISATFGQSTHARTLSLIPLAPTAVVFKPSTVVGGSKVQTRIVINGVAGPGGLEVSLSSTTPHALVPTSVTVPPGQADLSFTFTTTRPPASILAEVTATAIGGSKKAYLRINR